MCRLLGSKRTPDALGLKGCPGASIHRIAEKRNSRKPLFTRSRYLTLSGAPCANFHIILWPLPLRFLPSSSPKVHALVPTTSARTLPTIRALRVVIAECLAHELGFVRARISAEG